MPKTYHIYTSDSAGQERCVHSSAYTDAYQYQMWQDDMLGRLEFNYKVYTQFSQAEETVVWEQLASYPGRLGGEKRPDIDCLRMRGQFRYISVKL